MRGLNLLLTLKLSLIGLSHLLQMRGLKQQDQKYDDAQRMSHLLQMRGLKHCPQKEYNNPIMSHLLQMRGLKRNQPYKHYRPRQVASFTDAWIETYQSAGVFSQCQSHLLQMRGLKRPF